MIRNIMKITLRNIHRHKGYSFINIGGLSLGMTCVLLILLYVRHELSYDRFHTDADHIYRIATKSHLAGRSDITFSSPALAPALTAELPEIESTVRINKSGDWLVSADEDAFREFRIRFADANIFDIFSLPLVEGNPRTALTEPNCIIISEKTAKKYWGDSDPLEKTVVLTNLRTIESENDSMLFRVTGVFREIPSNTHFHADLIGSYASFEQGRSPRWGSLSCLTYIKIKNGTDVPDLQAKIQDVVLRHKSQEFEKTMEKKETSSIIARTTVFLQPVTSIHLHSHLEAEMETNGNALYVMIFSAVAVLVLIVACANFINLATARAGMRAREVGIRKVVGSSRLRLVSQFLIESSVLTAAAFFLAFIFAQSLLPLFNKLTGLALKAKLFTEPGFLLSFFLVFLLVSLMASLYPAFILSSSNPISVLKGRCAHSLRGRGIRRGLVIFQFTVSLILTIGTLVIFKQIRYIHTRNLGFDKEQLLIIHNTSLLGSQKSAFKKELIRNPDVISATVTSMLPLIDYGEIAIRLEGQTDLSQSTPVKIFYVDEDFIRTMGMEVTEGRDFSADKPTDKFTVIINETAAKSFGWETPLGKRFWYNALIEGENRVESRLFPVIGVVRDFNYSSIKEEISPAAIFLRPSSGFTAVRMKTDHMDAALGFIGQTWDGFVPGRPLEYSFMDERFESMYRSERMTSQTLGIFTFLAVLIGSMGIFGLAAFMAERRTKEIGIRKILGARIRNILNLLISEFVVLIVVSNCISVPIALIAMNKWLQGFAFRTKMGIDVFVFSGILTLAIALLSVSSQSLKAAVANPVDSLRYE